jgi:hypothetical protein
MAQVIALAKHAKDVPVSEAPASNYRIAASGPAFVRRTARAAALGRLRF